MEMTVDVVCVTSNTGAEMLPDGEREKSSEQSPGGLRTSECDEAGRRGS